MGHWDYCTSLEHYGSNGIPNTAYMTNETLQTFTKGEQDFYNNTPTYITAAFAIAVFAGALGCIALLLRKKFASTLFILSLIAVFVQFGYILLIQDFMEISGVRLIMPLLIILVAIFLAWYSKKAYFKNILS